MGEGAGVLQLNSSRLLTTAWTAARRVFAWVVLTLEKLVVGIVVT